ncbi:MAG: geranylgeranyl reductase family protein [Flavobacteriia bacterium]|nr:geranylgeranyl reductase family protein [Flavobacteriia bacterium]
MDLNFDVVIVGAGPAGATAAICLSESNLKVALIDKSEFPRDKVCGDGLSPDIYNQLKVLPGNIAEEYMSLQEKLFCNGVKIVAPNNEEATVRFHNPDLHSYSSTRTDFDNLLFQNAAKKSNVETFTGSGVTEIKSDKNHHLLVLGDGTEIKAKMVVGADGAHSVVASQLGGIRIDRDHHYAGLRVYFENVTGLAHDVELHFLKEILPGYLWIIPLPGNRANVGIGMLSSYISEKKVNLKQVLEHALKTSPVLAPRFADAKALETIKGMGLPLGSRKLSRSGDRYLLLGDAGHLIDPFTGEGIGNAIRSARIAADHIQEAFKVNQFDAAFNKAYDAEIKRRMMGEMRFSIFAARLMKKPVVANFVVKRLLQNAAIHQLIYTGLNPNAILRTISKRKFYGDIFRKVAL